MTKDPLPDEGDGLRERRMNERLIRWAGWVVIWLATLALLLFAVMWMASAE